MEQIPRTALHDTRVHSKSRPGKQRPLSLPVARKTSQGRSVAKGKGTKRLQPPPPRHKKPKQKQRSQPRAVDSPPPLPPIPVRIRDWCDRFPVGWNQHLIPDNTLYLCPESWLPWMHYQRLDCPLNTEMSGRLWPAITQLITVIYLLDLRHQRGLHLSSQAQDLLLAMWQQQAASFGLVCPEEVKTSLFLCKTALANHSPLTGQQKHFLMQFIACRTIQAGLKTDIFLLMGNLPVQAPAMHHRDMGVAANDQQTIIDQGVRLFGNHGPQVVSAMIESVDREDDTPPPAGCGIPDQVWRLAITFQRIWYPQTTVDLSREFNVGREDKLNSEYFSTIMGYLFGSNSSLNEARKHKLALLLDMAQYNKQVNLTLHDTPINWRDWLLTFQHGKHALPEQEGSLLPLHTQHAPLQPLFPAPVFYQPTSSTTPTEQVVYEESCPQTPGEEENGMDWDYQPPRPQPPSRPQRYSRHSISGRPLSESESDDDYDSSNPPLPTVSRISAANKRMPVGRKQMTHPPILESDSEDDL
ncbi:hypothetical protein [Parendozoicomonas haliclonae]|uniref:Uncharacterized protein n=1 Tax=Parendozoicomonas haliclonae TaxID=1960125 RepID=A0A1X7AK84_9GAMM|nr:hypothetical protein [Parendozoicomonas haliclonae]SMA47045.1 hypothetical protein EHSB41UT_02292 [Parendozoicomonas haliclonae]